MKSNRKCIHVLFLVVTSSLFLTACGSSGFHLGPKLGIKIPIEEREVKVENESSGDDQLSDLLMFSQLDNSENKIDETQQVQSQQFLGSGQFITQKPKKKSKHFKDVDGNLMLNFDAADLGEVAKIILQDMLNENYIISSKVTGVVTLQTTRGLREDELLPILEMLLSVNEAVLVKSNGIYRIEPRSQAIHTAHTSSPDRKKPNGYQISIIPLKFVGAADMAEIIQPVVPANAIIKVDLARNILMVAGTQGEQERVLDMVNTFDVDFFAGLSFGLFLLENTEVENTLSEIEKIFINGEKSPIDGMLRFISIKHLNAILVVSQQKAYLNKAEKWIKRLDIQNGVNGEGGIVVYRVQHVDAIDLASTMNEIVSGVSSSPRQSAPSIAPGQKVATISNKKTARKKVSSSRKATGKGNASLEGVSIIADESNNALVILAEPQQYRVLNKIIKQLDVMPLQVLIDATIVSVDLTDDLKYGVQWLFQNDLPGDYQGAGALGSIVSAASAAATGGFGYSAISASDGVSVLFSALAKDDKINVLSAPSLMVLNNHEASIKVGDSVPIRTTQSTNTSGGGSVNDLIQTSNIEMRDTGVTLTVKPRVNANGVVILEIEQKVDNAVNTQTSGSSAIDSPTILQRQIGTTVAVVNGESVVLGGLISETHTYSNTGLPFLKDIPYLGVLFGSKGKTVEKRELIVIITPRVVENKMDGRKVTDEFKRRLSGIYYDQEEYQLNNSEVLRDYNGTAVKAYR